LENVFLAKQLVQATVTSPANSAAMEIKRSLDIKENAGATHNAISKELSNQR